MKKITYNNKINKNKRYRKYNAIRFMFIKMIVDFLKDIDYQMESNKIFIEGSLINNRNEHMVINKNNIKFKINSILTNLKNSIYENDIYYNDFIEVYFKWFKQIDMYKIADEEHKESVLYDTIDKMYMMSCFSTVK